MWDFLVTLILKNAMEEQLVARIGLKNWFDVRVGPISVTKPFKMDIGYSVLAQFTMSILCKSTTPTQTLEEIIR